MAARRCQINKGPTVCCLCYNGQQLLKNLKILPLKSRYIFSLLLFAAENRDLYELNSEIHNINTRFSSDLHTPAANLITFQKAPFYFGIKVFNPYPANVENRVSF